MKPKSVIKNIGFCISLFFIFPILLHGQITFERYYGEPGAFSWAKEVFQKNDGGYIFGGCTQFSGTDIYVYLVRTDSLGDTLWTRFYGGEQTDAGYAMDITSDGGYMIAGLTNSFGAGGYDVYVVRTDSLGDTLWTRTYGGIYEDRGYSIKQTSDGGFIIAGRTNSYGAGGYDAYLIRIDSLGDTLWTRTYGDSLDDYAAGIEITSDNCSVITGTTWSFGPTNLYFIKTDSLGNVLWERRFGGAEYTEGYAVRQTSDSGYIITGEIYIFMEATTYVYLVKTNSSGDSLWAKKIGHDWGTGDEDHAGYSVEQTADSGYIITGYTQERYGSSRHLFLVKTDASGDTLWTRIYDYRTGYSVKQTSDGGYIISGRYSGGGQGQACLIKTDDQGNVAIKETPQPINLTKSCLRCSPNPFTDKVEINFGMYDVGCRMYETSIRIYDVSERLVKSLALGTVHSASGTTVTWQGKDEKGNFMKSGIYFLKLRVSDEKLEVEEVRKVIKIE